MKVIIYRSDWCMNRGYQLTFNVIKDVNSSKEQYEREEIAPTKAL